jgi:hypothetical protein
LRGVAWGSRNDRCDRHGGEDRATSGRRDLALADRCDQFLRAPFRSDVELALEQRGEPFGMRQRFVAAAIARIERQGETLPVLAQRIEAMEALDRDDRLLTVGDQPGVSHIGLAQACGGALHALTLTRRPLVEAFLVEIEAGEEFSAEQSGSARELRRIAGAAQALEFAGVDPPLLGQDLYPIGRRLDDIRVPQVLAQQDQRLAQALARLLVGAAAPQQGGEFLAGSRAAWSHRQIGDQCAALAGGHSQRNGLALDGKLESPEQAQAKTRRRHRHWVTVFKNAPPPTRNSR